MRFCGMCGTRLGLVCAACGFLNPANYRYCGNCGTQLALPEGHSAGVTPLLAAPKGHTAERPSEDEDDSAEIQPAAAGASAASALPLEGERRVATVVVADLFNSTMLLVQVGTEAWVELMNRVLQALEAEIHRFGGEVEQFRGDGLVAFFGATTAHEDDPERAVLAALSMQDALQAFISTELPALKAPGSTTRADRVNLHQQDQAAPAAAAALQLRVGISTGEVIIAGLNERRAYSETAMGLAVAMASRMEGAAEPGTVLVSETTYRLIRTQFEWQPLGEVTAKGISQPVNGYRPLAKRVQRDSDSDGESERVSGDAREFQFSTPLIGREAEFQTLKGCVEDVLAGRGKIVMLTGDKGMGKSYLVNELRQYFAHRGKLLNLAKAYTAAAPARDNGDEMAAPSSVWLRGRCRSYHQGWPYSMWIDLLQDWLSAQQCTSNESLSAVLRAQSEALWGENYVEHYPYLATLLSLPLEAAFTERVRHLDGEQLRQGYFFTLRSWVEALSRRTPLILTFADMQWADTSSLDVLKYCLPLCDAEALMFLFVSRPEQDMAAWAFGQHVEATYPHRLAHVALAPFDAAQSVELINHLIGPSALSDATCDLIVKNAAGNPYYIQELIRSLVTSGVLMRDEQTGQWLATRTVTTLDLPDSLQHLLQARIDRLSVEERFVLQIASVIGSVFWSNVVRALIASVADNLPATLSAASLTSHLAALQRARLIGETGRVPELGMQYLFVTPLLREAAYESVLTPHRVAYHAGVAEYLESNVSPDALVGYFGLLAHHYRHADNRPKELFYALLAADQARNMYANAEALQRYTRALELLDEIEAETDVEAGGGSNGQRLRTIQAQRFEVLKGRAEVLVAMGEIAAAQTDVRALLPLARSMPDDPAWLIDALLAQIDINVGDPNREQVIEDLRMAQEALDLARQTGDAHRQMRSLMAVGQLSFFLGRPEAKEATEQALQLARQLGDLRAEVNLLAGFSVAYGMDDIERSQAYLQEALVRSEQLNDKAIEIMLLGELSAQFERSGDYYRQLVDYAQKRLRISREIGNRFVEGDALMHCGQIESLYLGDYAAGLALHQEALRKWEPITNKLFPLLRIAQIQTEMGELAEAQATLDQARPIADSMLLELGRAGLWLVSAILYNELGDDARVHMALTLTSQVQHMVTNNLVSRQYRMAAACIAAASHLKLAQQASAQSAHGDGDDASAAHQAHQAHQAHLSQALASSQMALDIYNAFGFAQVVECTSEEILFRHSQALAANLRDDEAAVFLQRAYGEMMRKHDLIPAGSPYRRTYLDIKLHRQILAAHEAQAAQVASSSTPTPTPASLLP
jgi:class 3 adenylate cyclase/tetratricopeptide (TPR) repeat protein